MMLTITPNICTTATWSTWTTCCRTARLFLVTLIEKPHSFSTACNIATQIIAQVASNQYGGQSISLTHLAPFVDVSRKKIAAEVEAEMEGLDVTPERKKEIVERRLRNEINAVSRPSSIRS